MVLVTQCYAEHTGHSLCAFSAKDITTDKSKIEHPDGPWSREGVGWAPVFGPRSGKTRWSATGGRRAERSAASSGHLERSMWNLSSSPCGCCAPKRHVGAPDRPAVRHPRRDSRACPKARERESLVSSCPCDEVGDRNPSSCHASGEFFFAKGELSALLSALRHLEVERCSFAVRLVESVQVQLSRCLCRPSKTPAPNSEPSTLRCPARCCGGSSASGGGHPPPLPRRWRQRRQTLCRGGALRQRIPALRRRARGAIEAVSPRPWR